MTRDLLRRCRASFTRQVALARLLVTTCVAGCAAHAPLAGGSSRAEAVPRREDHALAAQAVELRAAARVARR